MALTKQWFIEKAYGELGLAAYVFDLQPEDWATALDKLDAMVGRWEGQGIRVGGWPMFDDPAQNTKEMEVYVPYTNHECIYTNLALRLAPNIGKQPEGPTIALARDSLRALMVRRVEIPQMQRPSTMPIGTGWNRGIKDRQFYQQRAQLATGDGQSLELDVWDRGFDNQPTANPTP